MMFTAYGDINRVETSGASKETSQQDRLGYSGVRASETMAQMDSERMNNYKFKINRVGNQSGIDPALIAAIISRESRAGNALTDGQGDHGNAWGLMQVDIRYHRKEGDWDSEEHLRQATGILVHFIERIQKKFPNWSREQQLKGLAEGEDWLKGKPGSGTNHQAAGSRGPDVKRTFLFLVIACP
ncbi:lysozyme g-like isoform X3 [Gambusia affinis]|uniref:lysozyme g-like isoform X3 n=1 Tax=Gambusia affinis TaxID=33528 RepID=UPI001CDD356A|nr:lysozyme g-like isoform X3 [Gambusia affinis]